MSATEGFQLQDEGDVVADMNTTPLIDVMLVLLVMLIITIPVQLHAVKLNLPQAPAGTPPAPPPVVQLDLGRDGDVHWNGTLLTDAASLDARLHDASLTAEVPEFHVHPERTTPYRAVAAVLSALQRQGLHKVGVVGS